MSDSLRAKQNIDQTEYIGNDKISKDGNIVSYIIRTKTGPTLVLKDLRKNVQISFNGVFRETVLTAEHFICQNFLLKELYRVNLKNLKIDTLRNIDEYQWIAKQKKFILETKSHKRVRIWDPIAGGGLNFFDISVFELSHDQEKLLLYHKNQELIMLDLSNSKRYIHKIQGFNIGQIKKIDWHRHQKAAYVFAHDREMFSLLKFEPDKLSLIYAENLVDSNRQTIIDTTFKDVRIVSDRYIALGLKAMEGNPTNEPEMWFGSSNGITPALNSAIKKNTHLGMLDMVNKKIHRLFDSKIPLTYGINYNSEQVYAYEVNDNYTKMVPDRKVYKYEKSFMNKSHFKDFTGYNQMFFNSKELPFMMYMVGNDWFLYDEHTHESKNLTGSSGGTFFIENNKFHLKHNDVVIQRFAVLEKRWLMFNDLNDIWFYDTQKKTYQQITNGKENKRVYRFVYSNYLLDSTPWHWGHDMVFTAEDEKAIHWRTEDYSKEGISIMTRDRNVIPLIEAEAKITQIQKTGNFITYLKQRANQPPGLYVYDILKREEKLIYNSNQWDTRAADMQTEFIKWVDQNGIEQGVLVRFPLNYRKEKKYPALVYIYEDKAKERHEYVSKTEDHGIGFNYKTYVEDEYFVIEPEIYYEYGNPGFSATNCVNHVLDTLLSKYSIDENRMGLVGHSFGGYETNFIISQTNRFKAAVSGAGIADLSSWYVTMNWEIMRPEFWRYPEQSFRMKKDLFELKDNYIANSPILQSTTTQTPLLIWSGKEDLQVHWSQSVAMFLALKKQNKNVNMLLYPKEKHALLRDFNKKDLTDKVKSWFDYYLKNKDVPDWLPDNL